MLSVIKCFQFFCCIIVLIAKTPASPPQNKIVGGHQANPGQFPYNVQLQWWGNHYCGGAIIDSEWIITAAHCAIQEAISYTVIANQYNVLVSEGNERRFRVTKLFQHPGYVPGKFVNDIALMKVTTPIQFDELVRPVALPPANYSTSPGSLLTVTGWGALAEDGLSSPYLHWVDIPAVSIDVCRNLYGELGIRVDDSMLCAGFIEGGHDSCSGDSGGPVIGQDLGYQTINAIVSNGVGCARPNLPGINTDVSYFMDWIEKVMEEN